MRLSEISGERVFDVIADITVPVLNIAMDNEASALFKREKCPKGEEPAQFMMKRIQKALPLLIKGHKEDLISIFSTLHGVEREKYVEGLNMSTLLKDFYEMMTDEQLLAFLS